MLLNNLLFRQNPFHSDNSAVQMADLEPTLPTVRPFHEFQSLMQSGIFTFLIGPEKAVFQLHTQSVAEASKVLDRLMNGSMKESIERQAELPLVEPAVFVNFANFCYSGGYELDGNRASSETDRAESYHVPLRYTHNVGNFGLALLRIDRQDHFYCAQCGEGVNLVDGETSFPYCSLEHAEIAHTNTLCFMCTGGTSAVCGPICKECIGLTLGMDKAELHPMFEDFWKKLEVSSRMAIWLDVVDNYTAPRVVLDSHKATEYSIFSDGLLSHAKMYTFADTYEVPGLKALSIVKLCVEMSWYEVTEARVPEIIALIEYTYQNTCDNSSCTRPNLLRRLVAKFVAFHAEVCMASDEVKALLSSGGEMVIDIMQAMASSS